MVYNRRSFLAASASGAAGLFVASCHKTEGEKQRKADQNSAINLQLIAAEYARLYNYIKEEKGKAEAAGKELMVISGEVHISSNSSILLELMLANIAARLGIENFVLELPQERVSELGDNARQATALARADQDYIYNFDIGLLQAVKDGGLSVIQFPPTFDIKHVPEREGFEIVVNYLMPRGIRYHAGDPLHGQFSDLPLVERYQKREEGMIGAMNKVHGHRFGNYGGGHLPRLVKEFGANERYHVVPLNFGCGIENFRDQIIDLIKKEEPANAASIDGPFRAWMEEGDRALAKYFSPAIPINPQLSASQCYALLMLAVNEHMVAKTNEMPWALQQELKKHILETEPNIPGVSGLVR